MSPRYARLFIAFAVASIPLGDVRAQTMTLEQKQRALEIIAAHADRICNAVRTEGSTQSAKVNGQINAGTSGIARQLVSLGVTTGGATEAVLYQGVRQQDLASALKDVSECRLRVSDNLVRVMLGPGGNAPTTTPAPPRPERTAPSPAERAAVAPRAMQPVATVGRPGWSRDRRSGCHVWNYSPLPSETVRWSGGCSDGKADGYGTADWLSPGAASRAPGTTAVRHVGTAVQGRFEGEVEEISDTGVRNRLQWAGGQPTAGWNTTTFPDGFQVAGHFQPEVGLIGNAIVAGPGFRYEGPVDQDLRPHGSGTASWNGESFRTTWTNGCAWAQGQIFYIRQDVSACQRLR